MKIDRIILARCLITAAIAPYLLIGIPNALGMSIFAKQTQDTILHIAVYWFIGISALMILLSLLYSSGNLPSDTNRGPRKVFKMPSDKLAVWGAALLAMSLILLVGGVAFIGNDRGVFVDRILPWIVSILTFSGLLLVVHAIYQKIQSKNDKEGSN